MKIDWYEKNDSPYNMVENIIENWCSDNGYSDMMVLLKIDGQEEKVYLECNASEIWTWEYDWFEGGEIELLGFCPVSEVMIPEKYMLKDMEKVNEVEESHRQM